MLSDLKKNTPKEHPDFSYLEKATELIEQVALTMEAGVNFTVQKENVEKIFKEIQDLPVLPLPPFFIFILIFILFLFLFLFLFSYFYFYFY